MYKNNLYDPMNKFKYDYSIDLNTQNAATKIIHLVGTNKRVLEFGCATGNMSRILHEQFKCDIIGVEIVPEAADIAREFCSKVFVGNIEELNFEKELEPKTFDVIIFADVLEHLKDPFNILKKVIIFLKDDGFVLASIPNIAHASIIMELIKGNFRYKPLGLLDDAHLRFFTKHSIYELFEKGGYVVSLIDRVKVPPESTEFKSNIQTIPREVRDYIYENNDDIETYQFIVKAYKSSETGIILKLREEIENLEREIHQKDEDIKQKDIMINRFQYSKSWRVTDPLRRLNNILRRIFNR